jgi:hypothetical protein
MTGHGEPTDGLDLVPDLNSQDDDGFGRSTPADATAPSGSGLER